MERMKLTEKEKEQILKNGAEAMSRIIERMSIKMGELEEENKKLQIEIGGLMGERDGLKMVVERLQKEIEELEKPHPKFSDFGGYDEDEHIVKDENTYRDLDL